MANRGDETVHQIAKRARDEEETAQQGPGPAQPPRDSQRGRRSQIHLAVLDQNQAARCLASHPIQGQERRGLVGLGRAKSKIPLRVTRRDELDGALAERAGPVEEDDGALINAATAWACVEGSRYHKLLRLDVHRNHRAGARHRVVQVVSELQGERVLALRQLSVEFRRAIAEMHA
jgi:hypothetical protein